MNEIFFTSGGCDAEDMKEFYGVHRKKLASTTVFNVVFIIAFIVCAVSGAISFYCGSENIGQGAFGALIFFSVLFIIEKNIIRSGFVKNGIRKTEKNLTRIDVNGIHTENDIMRCDLRYEGVTDFSESNGMFLLYTDKNTAIPVPKRSLCAMIPSSAGRLSVDVIDLFRNYVFAATGKRFIRRKRAKHCLIEIIALCVAVVLLVFSLFAGDILLSSVKTLVTSGYSIDLPTNLQADSPKDGGTFYRWNNRIEIYNFLDEMAGVEYYFGYVPSCEEYMNAVFSDSQGNEKFVTTYKLDNGTYCLFCEYAGDDCFYGRAITAGADGFWTTVFVGFVDERTNLEQYFVRYAGSINVR